MAVKQPPQWAIKQHIENNRSCEWICPHTSKENLGEYKPDNCICSNKSTELIPEDCPVHGVIK